MSASRREIARSRTYWVILSFIGAVLGGVAAWAIVRSNTGAGGAHEARSPVTVSRSEAEIIRQGREYEMDGRRLEDLSERERAAQFRDDTWAAEARFIPIDNGIEGLAREWRSSVRDDSGLLSGTQRSALLRHIAEHAFVRSQESPDSYRRLVDESEVYEWNRLGSETIEGKRRDFQVDAFFRFFLERPRESDVDIQQTLSEVWAGLGEHEHLFYEVGVGERGAAIVVQLARVPAQLDQLALAGKGTVDPEYWMSIGARYGMQFSRPVRYAAEAMEDGPGVIAAYSHILVKMRDGRIFNWMSRWYWDEPSGQWLLDLSQAHSSKTAMFVW